LKLRKPRPPFRPQHLSAAARQGGGVLFCMVTPACRSPRFASLRPTMQGRGQREPLILSDLHVGSCSCPRVSQSRGLRLCGSSPQSDPSLTSVGRLMFATESRYSAARGGSNLQIPNPPSRSSHNPTRSDIEYSPHSPLQQTAAFRSRTRVGDSLKNPSQEPNPRTVASVLNDVHPQHQFPSVVSPAMGEFPY